MIVGSGMVANAFRDLSGWDDDILFSSGVSNSGETDEKSFLREIEMIRKYLEKIVPPNAFVYFSTTSIFDRTKHDSHYIRHKLFIEDLIRKSGVNYVILRLPNLVGHSMNPNTLTNFFAESIRKGRTIKLDKNAVRHLIDVSDLSTILNGIRDKFGKGKITVNVETDKPITAQEILSTLEDAMMKKASVMAKNGAIAGESKHVNDSNTKVYLWKTPANYHSLLLRKYYSS